MTIQPTTTKEALEPLEDPAWKVAVEITNDRLGPRSDSPQFWDKYAAYVKGVVEHHFTPAPIVAPEVDESRMALNKWIQQDVEATSKQSLLKLAWSLGVVGNHEHEARECLLSVPELHLEDYPGGVAEIGPLDIQEDCLRAIDYLKTLIVLLNRLAIGDLDPVESKRVVAESTEYLERMRNFPIRSQHERAKSDRD